MKLKPQTNGSLELADAGRGRCRRPKTAIRYLDIPARSLSNVRYNKAKRFIEMGRNTNRRQLFNLSQAKSYMQTMLVASGCKQLIEQGKRRPASVVSTTCSSTRSKGPRKRRSSDRTNATR